VVVIEVCWWQNSEEEAEKGLPPSFLELVS
jgi:hypothetical protein